MKAREGLLKSSVFGDDLQKVLPVIAPGGSDTATFDNVLEFLVMAGRSLPHAMLMMIPEPWSGNPAMDPAVRAFYEYHSSLMEPWDGPASITFTDGTPDRRHPRSQRPAAVALLHHQGRPRDHGVGSRRPRHPRREHRRQGSAAARQDAARSTPAKAASSATPRSSRRSPPRIPTASGCGSISSTSRTCPAPTRSGPIIKPCCAVSRPSATRRKICGCC